MTQDQVVSVVVGGSVGLALGLSIFAFTAVRKLRRRCSEQWLERIRDLEDLARATGLERNTETPNRWTKRKP